MIILGLIFLALGYFRRKKTMIAGPDFLKDWFFGVGGVLLVAGLLRLIQALS